MCLWFSDGYEIYAGCILVISVLSVITALYETRTNLSNIKKMAFYTCAVNVLRKGELVTVNSDDLVPGDIIEIPEGVVMPCDIALLTGTAIVNEAMLTGESVPVIKVGLPSNDDIYDYTKDTKYTLYGGTKVI